MTTIRIICLGNELVRDDGIGVRVGRVLQKLELPQNARVELRRAMGLELLDELEPEQELIVVDATRTGRPPGEVHVMELIEASQLAGAPYCCHGMSLAEILEVARRMFPERLPLRVTVVGVEAEDLDDYGTALSPSMQRALPEAVERVLELLGLSQEARERGKAEAERWRGWTPTIEEVFGLDTKGGKEPMKEGNEVEPGGIHSIEEMPFRELVLRDSDLAALRREHADSEPDERRLAADFVYHRGAAGDVHGPVKNTDDQSADEWRSEVTALAIAPDYAPAILTVGTLEYELGRHEEALELLDGLTKLSPKTAGLGEILQQAATYLADKGDESAARELLRRAGERLPVALEEVAPKTRGGEAPMNVREILGWEGSYHEICREERNLSAILYHLLLLPENANRFLSLLDLSPDYGEDELEVYFEYSLLRDLWAVEVGRDVAKARKVILESLPLPEDLGLADASILELNELFGATPKASAEFIQSPARWSMDRFRKNIEDDELFLEICRFKWAFNAKPDIVIRTGAREMVCIEAKWFSPEGSYPTSAKEKAEFARRGLRRVKQTELQRYAMEQLLGYRTELVYLTRKPSSRSLFGDRHSITWREVFAALAMTNRPRFVRRWIDRI